MRVHLPLEDALEHRRGAPRPVDDQPIARDERRAEEREALDVIPVRVGEKDRRLAVPLAERVAYRGQWMRLSAGEAADKVRQRDERRAEFLTTHFHRQPEDVHQYDMVLNAERLGFDGAAALIVAEVKRRKWI